MLTKEGKVNPVVDSLVQTMLTSNAGTSFASIDEIVDQIKEYYGLPISPNLIQSSIERQINKGTLKKQSPKGSYYVPHEISAQVEARIESAENLELHVQDEWLKSIEPLISAKSLNWEEELWNCLRCYMAKVFQAHGADTIRLLAADFPAERPEMKNLTTYINEAFSQCCSTVSREDAYRCIGLFFAEASSDRVKYVTQLLDGTFTFFALSVDKVTASYLRETITPLTVFLDTNFIFGVVGLHINQFVEISKEVVDVIKKYDLPFKLSYHEETFEELKRTLYATGQHLRSRTWNQAVSRAAIASGQISGIEYRYHQLNAESPLDPNMFFEYYEATDVLLAAHGFTVYRDGYQSIEKDKESLELLGLEHRAKELKTSASFDTKDLLIAEYKSFLEARRRTKKYNVYRHDMILWSAANRLRACTKRVA